METKVNRTKRDFVLKLFWIFVIGSMFGFLIEMIYAFVVSGSIEFRRGLLYGPFIQIYGIGAIAYYLLISKVRQPKKLFFMGIFLGGILEYLCSFLQEVIFGTISWDYSNMMFNLNGRTSLLYCFYWGLIGIVYLKVFFPFFDQLDFIWENKKGRICTYVLFIFMIINIILSCMAGIRQDERKQQIPPEDKIDQFLDQVYPDEFMDQVYHNKKEVRKNKDDRAKVESEEID